MSQAKNPAPAPAQKIPELEDGALPDDPLQLFEQWYAAARAASGERADAMVLATCPPGGAPSARTVLLKKFGEDGFVFFTNYRSQKAQELEAHPFASLVFYWAELERQVRIQGKAVRTSREESAAYFRTRPRESQIAAWASEQSSPLASREELEKRYQSFQQRFASGEVPLPPFWGGYRVIPEKIEFWRGQPGRLHDRILYTRTQHGWLRTRLYP